MPGRRCRGYYILMCFLKREKGVEKARRVKFPKEVKFGGTFGGMPKTNII
jgi:hypothetical protein